MTKVLLTCIDTIPSFSLSVLPPLEAMEKQGLVVIRRKKTSDATQEDMLWCDVYVTVCASKPEDEALINACRHQGKYTVYYMGEDFLDMPFAPEENVSFRKQIVREQVLANIGACHCLWVSDPAMLGKYKCLVEKTALTVECIPEMTTYRSRAPYQANRDIQTEFDNFVKPPYCKMAMQILCKKPFAGTLFMLNEAVRKFDARWKVFFP